MAKISGKICYIKLRKAGILKKNKSSSIVIHSVSLSTFLGNIKSYEKP